MHLSERPCAVLYGHEQPVYHVAVSGELDLVLSASGGQTLLHTLSGEFLRVLRPPMPGFALQACVVTAEGRIVGHFAPESDEAASGEPAAGAGDTVGTCTRRSTGGAASLRLSGYGAADAAPSRGSAYYGDDTRSAGEGMWALYTINGTLLAVCTRPADSEPWPDEADRRAASRACISATRDGALVAVSGGPEGCQVVLRRTADLSVAHRYAREASALTALCVGDDERFLLAGTELGSLVIYALAADPLV